MTSDKDMRDTLEKSLHTLEEICENTRAIRRVVNRILDYLHEHEPKTDEADEHDPEEISWEDLDSSDDMFL
jgi:hypothetical protein